jgi:hypothetical protein
MDTIYNPGGVTFRWMVAILLVVLVWRALYVRRRTARVVRALVGHPCACGHVGTAHEHYRDGTDCTFCGPVACPRYLRVRI